MVARPREPKLQKPWAIALLAAGNCLKWQTDGGGQKTGVGDSSWPQTHLSCRAAERRQALNVEGLPGGLLFVRIIHEGKPAR